MSGQLETGAYQVTQSVARTSAACVHERESERERARERERREREREKEHSCSEESKRLCAEVGWSVGMRYEKDIYFNSCTLTK